MLLSLLQAVADQVEQSKTHLSTLWAHTTGLFPGHYEDENLLYDKTYENFMKEEDMMVNGISRGTSTVPTSMLNAWGTTLNLT